MAGDDDATPPPSGDSGSSASEASKLIYGDELYLHPNDSSITSFVNIKLKGTENYNVWSCAMTLALSTTKKIEIYDKVNGSETFNLHHQINSLKQNGTPDSDYYHTLNGLRRLFDAITKLPACSCDAQKVFKTHTNLIKLMQFLMGLDDIYQPIRSSLLTKEPLPDVKTAFSLISREESHRGSSFGSTGTKFLVFAAKKAPAIMHSNLNCGLPGHPIEKCYKIVRYPDHIKKKWANNNNTKEP
ncbi:hypothetical protein Tco_1354536 [Tanacetum coccineum]